jgi:aspartyl-tRNA(Asn)/glutamyl-tRNA(Gln) amidotransferase subunit A
VNAESLLKDGSYQKLREALDTGKVSSQELTQASLTRSQKLNPKLNAFISFCEESALEAAKSADLRLRNGERGALLGIPIAVKDLILVKDHTCTAASKMLENFQAPYDATVVAKLKAAGSPIIGKANLDEFAMGSSNESSFFGAVKNPWDMTKVPGGSSGGSAAAVAARCVTLSLGTDTGGSIRQPSALCGITGLKPSYGRVSRYGVVAFASSLDQVGPMCSDALGCAAVLDTISGHDVHDATSGPRAPTQSLREVLDFTKQGQVKGLRIGIPKEYFSSGLSAEVAQKVESALEFFKKEGAELVEISLPHTSYALSTYYLICTAECSSNLARYDGIHYGHRTARPTEDLESLYSRSRSEGFGAEVRRRILLGTFALSSGYFDAYFQKAAKARRLIATDFEKAFEKVDLIAGPTSPFTAFSLGEKLSDPLQMYMSDIYTLSTNLAGIAGLSFNVGRDSGGLPIGMQVFPKWWQESLALKVAAFYQKLNPETLKGVADDFGL